MTIKQTGGIFGRNTDVKSAEIEDLTVTGSSTLSGAFSVQGTTGLLKQGADGNVLQIARGMNTDAAVVRIGSNRTGDGSSYIDMFGTSGATFGARLIRNAGTNGTTFLQTKGTGSLVVRTDDAGDVVVQTGGAEAARFNTSGNLAFPSGQGIDFSATSGTGTSELFDDYEEGTWTPTIIGGTSAGTGTYSQQDGVYTKVGNLVTVSCYLAFTAHTGSGHMKVNGLPFAGVGSSLDFQAGATQAQYINAGTSATQLSASVVTTASNISLYGFVNNAAKVATQVNASASGSQLAITLTYRTS
jgi:hypothetical protein